MASVLAVVLTMTLNTGAASAAITEVAPGVQPQAQATGECTVPSGNIESAGTSAVPEMVQLDGEASAVAASLVTALAHEAGIVPQTPAEFVNHEGVKVYALNVDGVTATSVTFPIEGSNFVQPSNVSYLLDEAGHLSQYSESTVVEGEDGLIELNTYRDGVIIHSAELDPSTLSAGQPSEAKADNSTACLMAVLGVSAVVAGILLVLCGGSCSVPVTPPTAAICIACIAGFATIGGASITAVMGCF